MKVVLRGDARHLVLIGALANAHLSRVETTLRKGVAGRIRVGMNVDALSCEYGLALPDIRGHSSVPIFFDAESAGVPSLVAEIESDTVRGVRVNSPAFRTGRGVRVGSDVLELLRLYEVQWHRVDVAYVDSLRMRFEIAHRRVASIFVS